MDVELNGEIAKAVTKGLETWMVDMELTAEGVELVSCINITDDTIKD